MGGNVAWTIRLSDGTEHRMQYRTNPIPYFIKDADFLAEKPEAIAKAIDPWYEWKADWEANKHTKDWEHRATPFYAPYPWGLKPSEYGVFLVDFKTKTVIDCQHYTNLNLVLVFFSMHPDFYENPSQKILELVMDKDDVRDRKAKYAEEKAKVQKFFDEDRVISYQDIETGDYFPIGDKSLDDVLRLTYPDAATTQDTMRIGISLKVKLPDGWELKSFSSYERANRQAAFKAIQDCGFALSDAETSAFKTWIDHRWEDG